MIEPTAEPTRTGTATAHIRPFDHPMTGSTDEARSEPRSGRFLGPFDHPVIADTHGADTSGADTSGADVTWRA